MSINTLQQPILVAAFADPVEARQCIEDLRRAGYTDTEIGVVAPDHFELDREEIAEHSMVAEGSVFGAFAGASIGSIWGIAMAAGLLPVIGPIMAGGMLASVVVTAATGAALGGLAGGLVGLGVPEEEAARYEQKLHEGQVLITIRPQSRVEEALQILERHHAGVETA
jgi:hypothetical protein